ncbi:MAG: lipopolysaccharide biosynthesis protein [Tenuifilaceae bacterium]
MKSYFTYFTQHLLKSELLRSASILITGTVLAQLISILLQPFLRRFFSPESFGLFSVYLSIVGIILVVSSLRYDDAIVLPVKDKESSNILVLSLLLSFVINLFLFLIVLFWGDSVIKFLNLPEKFSSKILFIIPISVFLYNTYQSFNYWLIRKKRYYAVSANKLIRRSTEGVAQIVFAFLKNIKGLIYGDIIGQSSNVITVVYQSVKNGFTFRNISIVKLKYVFGKYSEFPKYNLIPAVMSSCSYLLPPIFINKYFSIEYTGYYDLTKLLLSIPLALVATAFSNVLLQKISERYQKKESFLSDLKPILLIILVICLFEISIILLFGVGLFKLFFGQIWGFSGEISKILVWSFVLNFIVSSFSCLFISMRKIKIYSIWQFFYFIAILSLLFFKDLIFIDFLKVYVFIEVACYISLAAMMFFIVSKYERSLR